VIETLSLTSGGDLSEFAVNAIYGDLMAETTYLDAKDTGLMEFLACYAIAGSSGLQAKSHMYGAKNLGNGRQEIKAAVALCHIIEEEFGWQKERPVEQYKWLAKADEW
jgi:alkylhydroperoxidase/carboxymuconolactone decarboxylase family protein YurZ